MTVTDYAYIPKQPDKRDVLRRMGYNKKTTVAPEDMADIDRMIAKAADLCRPKGRLCLMPILNSTEAALTLENGDEIISEKLVQMMDGSQTVMVMGATLEGDVAGRVNHELKDGDMVFAVVLDAYASECVDDALSYMMQTHARDDFRSGKKVTKHRFSAGYGDLDIKFQKIFYDILKFNEIGVSINDSFMLVPEKSVIAVAGVKHP